MPLEIIGAGMGRTGTDSLARTLEILGYGPCHHMFEISDNRNLLPDWQKIAMGENVPWARVFRGYRSQVDWPGACYWKELATEYPRAKVILTVRDPYDWHDSMLRTIAPKLRDRAKVDDPYSKARLEMANTIVAEGIFGGRLFDREYSVALFKRHIEYVVETIAPERLLVFEVADGWRPLAEFLGTSEPDLPFPNKNSSKEFVLRDK